MILMALVIAMFVIVGVYVGYHASQQVEEEGEAHNINIDLEIINQDSRLVQILQNPEFKKTIL
jgi:Mn2+/Fe2+ NRAMP family transporter